MSRISDQEESLLLSLATMFEGQSVDTILGVIRRNNCDQERCVDELLTIPIPSSDPISMEEFELIPDETNIELQVERPTDAIQMVPLDEHVEEIEVPVEPTDISNPSSSDDTAVPSQSEEVPDDHTLIKENRLQRMLRKHQEKLERLELRHSREVKALQMKNEQPTSEEPSPFVSPFSMPFPRYVRFAPINVQPATTAPNLPEMTNATPTNGIAASDREELLLQRIKDLEESNTRLQNEKKNGMKFVLEQLSAANAKIQERDETIARMELELKGLHDCLASSKNRENKLKEAIARSKDILIDSAQVLSKNVGKVQFEANQLFQNTTDYLAEDFNILDKLKEFAAALKDALNRPKNVDGEPEKTSPNAEASETDEDTDEEGFTRAELEKARLQSLLTLQEETARQTV